MVNDSSINENDFDDKPTHSSKKYIHRFNSVSMLYADIKGFTELSTILTAEALVRTLNGLFAEFDRNADKHGCTRIRKGY
jgi:adenylate cyclase 8